MAGIVFKEQRNYDVLRMKLKKIKEKRRHPSARDSLITRSENET